ncbi:hypothetical protein HCCG_00258 [Helicobacter cinaedi CCUG 18818 = ATCC BAA-847]|uniref:Uncharacterized protein n=1 Tax=Helicobacter cinaedi CCUG 18818 = ATCC BAA-847 TaxID=537971 RepID=A0ABN0B882_9HELI|nr:hypothetical protein HCCG_00258 [Helicobacter cinaedi CCUG 18818 = ATCC BAA-847]BBB20672.1 hypothetical protein HC081234_18490 [Helicobacter cinaedi]
MPKLHLRVLLSLRDFAKQNRGNLCTHQLVFIRYHCGIV